MSSWGRRGALYGAVGGAIMGVSWVGALCLV